MSSAIHVIAIQGLGAPTALMAKEAGVSHGSLFTYFDTHLSVSEEITPESFQAGHRAFAEIARLLERSRAGGPMRDAPIGLVAALMTGVAEAAMNVMARDPAHAEAHCGDAFDAMWRMIA